MADPFTGEIRAFGFSYAPQDWAFCNGGRINITQAQALYSIIGGIYGSTDNRTYFSLPNLQGLAAMHMGTAPNQPPISLAVQTGEAAVTLLQTELPAHTHQVSGGVAQSAAPMTAGPTTNSLLSRPLTGTTFYWSMQKEDNPNTLMAPQMVAPAGQGQAHENRQPFLALNFCICLNGEYPRFQ